MSRRDAEAYVQDGALTFPGSFQPRVFWPGDAVPEGTLVMARDGSVAVVPAPGVLVWEHQPDPLVEVLRPDFESLVRVAYGRRKAREEMSDD